MKKPLVSFFLSFINVLGFAQDADSKQIFEDFKKSAQHNYNSFRDECNQKYAEFLRAAWDWYQGKASLPIPKEKNPVPPRLYEPIDENLIAVEHNPVKPVEPKPQPKPISPIRDKPNPEEDSFPVNF